MVDRRLWVARTAMRNEWLGQVQEEILDPDREIIDPHHHLWSRGGSTYEMEQLWFDTGAGHNVVETVFIECFANYRDDGPDHLKPVGETEYVAGLADLASAGKSRVTGVVAHADLRLPLDLLDEVLNVHTTAAGGRFRGIRHAGAYDPNPDALAIPGRGTPGQYLDPDFRRGVAHLGERGLTFDTWHYHHQNRNYLELAKAAPETTMILDHFGGPLGVGPYAGRRDEIFAAWKGRCRGFGGMPKCRRQTWRYGHAGQWLGLARTRPAAHFGRVRRGASPLVPSHDRLLRAGAMHV